MGIAAHETAMNYYEHHLGDYIRDTAHLSLLEEGAYRRLIDWYYIQEAPLVLDLSALYKVARAFTKAERRAVECVVGQFFVRQEDGFHQKRADEEIARYQEGEPEREAKRENDRERQRRARTRRQQLFAAVRELGQVAPFDASTSELERLLSHLKTPNGHGKVTPPVTDMSRPVTCDNTASQTPLPTPHSPSPISHSPPPLQESGGGGGHKRFRTWQEIQAEEDARKGARHAVE